MNSTKNKTSYINLFLAAIASCLLIIWFTLTVARHIGVNADAIYTYSFAKDIVQGVQLSTWTFPSQLFVFPDVILSVAVVFFFHDPVTALYFMSSLQIIAIILLVALMQKNRIPLSFLQRFVAITYLLAITYFLGRLFFHNVWNSIADKIAVLDHHMFGAICALALHFVTSPDRIKIKFTNKCIYLSIIFFAASFSDPFFFFYFFAFAFARVCVMRKATLNECHWMIGMGLLFLVGAAGISLNHCINPNLLLQLQNSKVTLDRTKFFAIIRWKGMIMFLLPLLLVSFFATNNKNSINERQTVLSTALGIIMIVASVAGAGLIFENYQLRYVGIFFPVIIYLLANRMPLLFFRISSIPIVSLITIAFVAIKLPIALHDVRTALFPANVSRIFACKEFQNYQNNATVIGNIDIGKILFELSGRHFRLLQTSDLKTSYPWMYNASWATLALKPNDNVLFITDSMPKDKLKKIAQLPFAKSLCAGEVILAKQGPKLAIIAPISEEL